MKITRKKILIASGVLVGMIAMLVIAATIVMGPYRDHARKQWKDQAIQEISSLADDDAWVQAELVRMRENKEWLSKQLILLESGEWIIYKNEDVKRDWRINDILIAKSSEGEWYYSTFHFCINMTAFEMCQETQASDLAYLIEEYRMEKFDGVSDDALKPTKNFPASWDKKHKLGQQGSTTNG